MPTRLNGFVDNIFYHEVEINNYPLFEFPLYSIALASKMVEVAKFNDLDLIHAHYAIPHATSAYLAREILKSETNNTKYIKFITTLHGTDITLTGLEPSFLPTMKFSIEKSDGVTAVSKFLADKTQQQYKINKDIEVIPNFIDTSKYKRDKRHTISSKTHHMNVDYSGYEGWEVKGKVETVLLRGKIAVDKGKVKVKKGYGKFVKRGKVSKVI
jgi:N-acetyl-alpha-D-glucosaminyl L-malate synthase BshA